MKRTRASLFQNMDQIIDTLDKGASRLVYSVEDTVNNVGTEAKFAMFGLIANIAADQLGLSEMGVPFGEGLTKALDVGGDVLIAGAVASAGNKFINNFMDNKSISELSDEEFDAFMHAKSSPQPVKVPTQEEIAAYNAKIKAALLATPEPAQEEINLNLDDIKIEAIKQLILEKYEIRKKLKAFFPDGVVTSVGLTEAMDKDPTLLVF